MRGLHGVGVLVTRPELQAGPLCRLLESRGAVAIRLPALAIKPVGDLQALMTRIGPIEAFDIIIFTSANAARFGAPLLGARRELAVAAIGPATARALDEAGIRVTVAPAEGFDSENLLLQLKLQRPSVRRALIVKGMRGRELLQEQLAERGAQVIVAEVYERMRANHDTAELAAIEARFAAGAIDVITATSVDIVANLFDLATPALRREFIRMQWLVPSERIAAALRERGVGTAALRANSAEDHDLVAAIERWRSSVSGA